MPQIQLLIKSSLPNLAIVTEVRSFTNGMEDKITMFTKMSDCIDKIVEMDNK